MELDTQEFGRIVVSTVPYDEPGLTATYTPSGTVLVMSRPDPNEPDLYRIAVLNDDGTDVREIFYGQIPQHDKANGIRHMVFTDTKRVLLGDYVLECTPDLDSCETSELIEVRYPWDLETNPLVTHHWSEIIVSQDDEHISWTILQSDMGAATAIGRLRRTDDAYVIEEPQLIGTVNDLTPDPEREGYFVPQPVRGGEVKQFVHGGTAISLVGSAGGFLPDSVIQDLAGEDLIPMTKSPGYDETTIVSPDGHLGIVMTSRASKSTNPAVLGLLPRPHALLVGSALAWAAYTYTVTGVRLFRQGNIGPVLIDIERSRNEPGYRGVALNDPDGSWVYVSPMSWHPDGTRVLWPEMRRGQESTLRIRIARLLDHVPGPAVETRSTPETIPYAVTGDAAAEILSRPTELILTGRIAGRHSGYIEFERRTADLTTGHAAQALVRYVGFSDDGVAFYDGYESATSSFSSETCYEADLALTGEPEGEMKLRMTWSGITNQPPGQLLFETAADGQPKSHGHTRLGETALRVEDLVP